MDSMGEVLSDLVKRTKTKSEPPATLYNGKTEEQIKEMAHRLRGNLNEATKKLIQECFSLDDLLNCSVAGKRSVKCGQNDPRPTLDPARFDLVQRLVLDLDHTKDRKWLIGRIQSPQKVLRVKCKNQN